MLNEKIESTRFNFGVSTKLVVILIINKTEKDKTYDKIFKNNSLFNNSINIKIPHPNILKLVFLPLDILLLQLAQSRLKTIQFDY